MSNPIQEAIDRQLSAVDRGPLGVIDFKPGDDSYDGWFAERVIHEAIDATLEKR